MDALTDVPVADHRAGIQYGTRGIVSRDVVARTLMDALAVVAEWPGCYELVRLLDGRWELAFTYLSLFSGIGGLDLGLDRAGMTCVGQVEIDGYCRTVLDRHWPEVPKHDDVRTAPAWWVDRGNPPVDLVAGGFPCTPFSVAGLQRGTADERWGWPWFYDVLRVVRPRYVLVENVAALVRDSVAFGWVLGDLHRLGFDAQWSVVSACTIGAPHRRQRVFLVAYPRGEGLQGLPGPRGRIDLQPVAEAARRHWSAEPDLARVADGVPRRLVVDPIRGLGNAVVPAVGEVIGRLILADARELVPA